MDYHEAVHRLTLDVPRRVDADELDRIVDRRWDPPVTAGVRLVSLVGDCLQHLGQAAYVKGLPYRRAEPVRSCSVDSAGCPPRLSPPLSRCRAW